MSDRWNEALEAAADKLRVRACGYLARYDVIYNGRIVSEELFGLAEAILAMREAEDQRGAAEQEAAGCAGTTEHSAQSAPHHPGGQEKAEPAEAGRALSREEFMREVGGKPFEAWTIADIRRLWLIALGAEIARTTPASPGPTVVEKLRDALRMVLDDYTTAGVRLSQDHYIHVALAAAEEERK